MRSCLKVLTLALRSDHVAIIFTVFRKREVGVSVIRLVSSKNSCVSTEGDQIKQR